jgi:hypothetical protein
MSWTTVGTPFIQTNAKLRMPYMLANSIAPLVWFAAAPIAYTYIAYRWTMLVARQQWPSVPRLLLTSVALLLVGWLVAALAAREYESTLVRFERWRRTLAITVYGYRWLGLWSVDDEAIAGLRGALALRIPIVLRRGNPIPAYPTDEIHSRFHLYALRDRAFALGRIVFNNIAAPQTDKVIWRRLKQAIYGTDRPHEFVESIDCEPDPCLLDSLPLPHEVSIQLCDSADAAASRNVPHLRKHLSSLAFIGDSSTAIKTVPLDGSELVHGQYLKNDDILQLIAAWMMRRVKGVVSGIGIDRRLFGWLNDAARNNCEHIENLTIEQCLDRFLKYAVRYSTIYGERQRSAQ